MNPLRASESPRCSNRPGFHQLNAVALAIILAGAFARWADFGAMSSMLHHDEAYYGIDAVSLLQAPRLVPFFPDNYGRESGWIYVLTPFVGVFGAYPFALRLAATSVGILTLAAAHRLGKEILGPRGAVWATAALSGLYWHLHLSHLALRAILFPLIGTLAFALLLRAQRTLHRRDWVAGGALLGLTAYTYFSARLWIGYAAILLIGWTILDARQRIGSIASLAIAVALALPLGVYTLNHPQAASTRIESVGVLSFDGIQHNFDAWLQAWFSRGDINAEFNLPGRPILDAGSGILFLIGIVGLPFAVRRKWQACWLLGLAAVSVAPSLLSDRAPNFLRAIGLTLPIAFIVGAGAISLERAAGRALTPRIAALLPAGLLLVAGVTSYQDFHEVWLNEPELPMTMEEYVDRSIRWIKASISDETPVYFAPYSPAHPTLRFRQADLAPRPVGAFDSHECLVVPDRPAVYVAITQFNPSFQRKLSAWADTSVLFVGTTPPGKMVPLYTILQATPRTELRSGAGEVVFGDAFQLRLLQPIESALRSNTTVSIVLGLKALRPIDRPYSVFIHLYSEVPPEQGGTVWSQGDRQMCVSYPPMLWRPNETVIQEFELPILPGMQPGTYRIEAGVYESPAGARLPITFPASQPYDHFHLQDVHITDGGP